MIIEESPGSIEQDAGLLPVRVTLRKVQQKRYRLEKGKGEMARQELTSNQATGWLCKPHLEQDR